MGKGKIVIKTFGGRINIVSRARTAPPDTSRETGRPSEGPTPGPVSPIAPPEPDGLLVPAQLIQLMEIRAESVFRPKEDDYEVAYALSGRSPGAADMLHKLASNTVIVDASPDSVQPLVKETVEHVQQERGGVPRLIVQLHTHPQSIPEPSDADRAYFRHAAPAIRSLVPGVKAIFAIHAVSSETIRRREPPDRTAKNRIRWTSITREHEIAFYDETARPYEVRIHG